MTSFAENGDVSCQKGRDVVYAFETDAVVTDSDEDKPGVILDYDRDGNLVSLEILDASKRVTEARRFEFETMG